MDPLESFHNKDITAITAIKTDNKDMYSNCVDSVFLDVQIR